MTAWGAACVTVFALLAGLVATSDPARAQTLYGYEDGLGMLHASTRRVDGRYRELCALAPGQKRPDHAALVAALREKDAIDQTIPKGMGELVAGLDVRGEAVLRAAEGYLGAPYLFGGDTPVGIDCSGLTRAVYLRLGACLPRHSAHQAAMGVAVERDMLAPGDLLFFSTDREAGINHVGIFLGGGQMLHSSSRAAGVRVERMDGGDYARWYVTARRIAAPADAKAKAASQAASGAGERRVTTADAVNPTSANL